MEIVTVTVGIRQEQNKKKQSKKRLDECSLFRPFLDLFVEGAITREKCDRVTNDTSLPFDEIFCQMARTSQHHCVKFREMCQNTAAAGFLLNGV